MSCRELVPSPAMTRDHFIRKFGKQGKYSTVPIDMIHEAFEELDQDGDGAPHFPTRARSRQSDDLPHARALAPRLTLSSCPPCMCLWLWHGAIIDTECVGHLGGDHETGAIKTTLEGIHNQVRTSAGSEKSPMKMIPCSCG